MIQTERRVFFASALLPIFVCLVVFPSRADDPVSSSVRYNREIVRIFNRKCAACHSENNLSVSLGSYQNVRSWSRAIREEILERRMPPWPAVNGIRPLANELSLTTRELAIITAWVDGGMPRGDAEDLPASKPGKAWPSGDPDLRLLLPRQTVKDDAVRRVTVETKIPSGRWLSGFDVSPGERRALRSAFLFVKEQSGREQWIGGWTPWHAMTRAPSNTGYRLPAGAELLLELHYKSTEPGKTLVDDSALGLYLQSNPPRSVIQDVHVNRETTLKQDLMVWALKPELTGGSIEARAIIPDGRIEPLLWVKNNSTDWQLPYVLRDPVRLPRGTRIISKGAALCVLAYPPH